MADTERNQREMINTMFALRQPLEPRGHHIGGDLLIYYKPANGLDPGTLWVSPDVFVALDRDTELRKSWKTWVEGTFPEVVVAIAPPTTEGWDMREKLDRYGALGAREYYIHDPERRLRPGLPRLPGSGQRAAAAAEPKRRDHPQRGARPGVPGGGRLAAGDRPGQRTAVPGAGGGADLQRQAEQGQRQAELAQRQVEARALNEEIARRDAEQACRDAVGIARSMVLKIVARRFGEVSDSFIARLAVIADPGHLDRLADSALAAPSLELFIQGLGDSDRP